MNTDVKKTLAAFKELSNRSRKLLAIVFLLGTAFGSGIFFIFSPYKDQIELSDALDFSVFPSEYNNLLVQLDSSGWDGQGPRVFRFNEERLNNFEGRLKDRGYTNSCSGHPFRIAYRSMQVPPADYNFKEDEQPARTRWYPEWFDVRSKQTQLVEWKRRVYPRGSMAWVLIDRAKSLVYVECEQTY